MKKYFVLLASIIILNSCKPKIECELPNTLNSTAIQVIFKNKATDKYLYSVVNPLYNLDSFKIINMYDYSLMHLLYGYNSIPNTNSSYSEINFGNIYVNSSDSVSFTKEHCKQYLIYYDKQNVDTIRVCFKSTYTTCGSEFIYLKLYHKNILVDSITNNTHMLTTIYKN